MSDSIVSNTKEEWNTFLLREISENNIKNVKELLEKGANPNAIDEEGFPALHVAAFLGHGQIIEALIEAGVDIDSISPSEGYMPNHTALHVAALKGKLTVIEILVGKGANLEITLPEGETPLHLALLNDKRAAFEKLIEMGANIEAPLKGYTPLVLATLKRNIAMIKLLIQKAANIAFQTADGNVRILYDFDIEQGENKIFAVEVCPGNAIIAHYIGGNKEKIFYWDIYRVLNHGYSAGLIGLPLFNAIKKEYSELFFSNNPPSEQHIETLFSIIREITEKEIATAKKLNKPVLLVYGEIHQSLNAVLLQLILLQIAKENNVVHFFIEASENILQLARDGVQAGQTGEVTWLYAANQLNMHLIPFDLDPEKDDYLDCSKNFDKRNKREEKIICNTFQSGVLQNGYLHMQFLAENDLLNEKYHMILFNFEGFSDKKVKENFFTEENRNLEKCTTLFAAHKFSQCCNKINNIYVEDNVYCLSSEEIVAIVDRVCKKRSGIIENLSSTYCPTYLSVANDIKDKKKSNIKETLDIKIHINSSALTLS